MFRNICLIGLPYSGKSVIGQKLYKHLNKGFIDTDDVIRQMYNCSLPTLIKNV